MERSLVVYNGLTPCHLYFLVYTLANGLCVEKKRKKMQVASGIFYVIIWRRVFYWELNHS